MITNYIQSTNEILERVVDHATEIVDDEFIVSAQRGLDAMVVERAKMQAVVQRIRTEQGEESFAVFPWFFAANLSGVVFGNPNRGIAWTHFTPPDKKLVLADVFSVNSCNFLFVSAEGTKFCVKGIYQCRMYGTLLRKACFRQVELFYNAFVWVHLDGAQFINSDFTEDEFHYCSLENADFSHCKLQKVFFKNSNLTGVSFRGATLDGVQFHNCDLTNVDFSLAKFVNMDPPKPTFPGMKFSENCVPLPPVGEPFRAFKKVRGATFQNVGEEFVLELEIPEDAQRVSTPFSTKCRADKARGVRALNLNGEEVPETEFRSLYDLDFVYRVDEVTSSPNFNSDPYKECVDGLHFYPTFEEAARFVL